MHLAEVADPCRILAINCTMLRQISVPQAKPAIRRVAKMRPHPLAVPIGLPGEGFAIPQGFDEDHAAIEPAGRTCARRTHRTQRAEQYGALQIARRAIGAAKLIPNRIFIARRHLMPVISPRREEIAVVDLNLVTGTQAGEYGWIDNAEQDMITADRAQRQPLPRSFA
jgi:hypothetical protein